MANSPQMNKIALVVMAGVLFFGSAAFAEVQTRVISLKDGSTVQGKLVGVNNGVYTVETATLGTLSLKEEDVQSVGVSTAAPLAQNPGQPTGAMPSSVNTKVDFQAAQKDIMSNPALMADIQSIAADPEIVALVTDPAFMEAAQAKDINAISANPRTAKLMQNPKIKALIEKIQASRTQ